MWPRAVREAKRGENSRLLTGLRIRKAYLRGLAVRQDAVPLVCVMLATCTRERETELQDEENGEERRVTTTHATADTARISQQRCPNMTVPHESFNLFHAERNCSNRNESLA